MHAKLQKKSEVTKGEPHYREGALYTVYLLTTWFFLRWLLQSRTYKGNHVLWEAVCTTNNSSVWWIVVYVWWCVHGKDCVAQCLFVFPMKPWAHGNKIHQVFPPKQNESFIVGFGLNEICWPSIFCLCALCLMLLSQLQSDTLLWFSSHNYHIMVNILADNCLLTQTASNISIHSQVYLYPSDQC